MKSKIIKKSLVVLLFLCFVSKAKAQSNDLNLINFITIQNLSEDISFFEGKLILENNEVLTGNISINHNNKEDYETILQTDKGYAYISNEDIASITLFGSENDELYESEFVKFENSNKFYRELYKKDDANAIYDLLEQPFDNKTMNDVYVLEDNELISINNFWSSGPKKDVINYINKRDGTNYKRKDFETLNELLSKL